MRPPFRDRHVAALPLVALLLAALLLAAWGAALADSEPDAEDEREGAAEAAREMAGQLGSGVPQATTASPAATVPGYSSTPSQLELGELGEGIRARARAVAPDNAAADMVDASATTRQRMILDQDNDPMLRRSRAIAEDSEAIVGMDAASSSDCATVPAVSAAAASTERCTSWNASARSCTQNCYCPSLEPVISEMRADGDMTARYDMPQLLLFSGDDADKWDSAWGADSAQQCWQHDAQLVFNVSDLAAVADFSLQEMSWLGHVRLELNGHQALIGPHSGQSLELGVKHVRETSRRRYKVCSVTLGPASNCEAGRSGHNLCCRYRYHTIVSHRAEYSADYGLQKHPCDAARRQRQPGIDLRPWLRQGVNVLKLRLVSSDSGGARLRLRARAKCSCENADSISDGGCGQMQRSSAQGLCQLQQSSCLDAPSLCSRQRRSYLCLGSVVQEEPYCGELRQRGCVWKNSRCVDTDDKGNCIEREQEYQCGGAAPPPVQIEDCGARVACIGADCTDTSYSPSGDFASSASHLAAIEEMASDFDHNSLSVFAGGDYRCKKTILGFANCCRDSGWGVSLGLSNCSDSERVLGEKRQAGQCHYVGSYKRGSLFKKKRYQSFCCFSSKLGRVVQQQGRAQLGLGWGAATAPACRGLSTDELGRLDFERIDLSEVHADMMQQAADSNPPASDVIAERLRQRLREMQ